MSYEWDNKKPTTQMLGSWQPFHDGHYALFEEIIKKTGQVCIQIRDVQGVDDNPFDFETVKKNIEERLNPKYKNRFKIMLVPNITNICYGRGVGYKIEELVLPEKIQQISSPDILYEKPENAFVAQFIGENNQIKGKVKSINGEMCVVKTEKGEEIKSLKVNVNSVGDASTVSLRPERVEINSSDSSFENSFDAKVKELIYLGDHIRTRVEVCGNDQFIVKVPNSYKGANLKEGTSVKLSWKASDSRALDLR